MARLKKGAFKRFKGMLESRRRKGVIKLGTRRIDRIFGSHGKRHLSPKAQAALQSAIRTVMKEGIRGRKVGMKQAVAVGFSKIRKKGFKVPKPR